MAKNKKSLLYPILVVITFIFICFSIFVNFYTEVLWFNSINYSSVFWKSFNTEYFIWFIAFLFFLGFTYLNAKIAGSTKATPIYNSATLNELYKFKSPVLFLKILLFSVGFIMASVASSSWMEILTYTNREPFGIVDPIFERDLGFYIFQLPLYYSIKSWLMALLIITLLLVVLIYFYKQSLSFAFGKFSIASKAQIHISILLIGIFSLQIVTYWLRGFSLLYSERGSIFFGAGYTDINAQLISYRIMIAVIIIGAALVIFSIIKQKWQVLVFAVFLYFASIAAFTGIYPSIVQKFIVEPNEQAKEVPYIGNNITFTRAAYELEKIEEKNVDIEDNLTLSDINNNKQTIKNIMLWDYRPLLTTFRQLQVIRTYYNFYDLDIDRYTINDDYRQVMISAREIDLNRLPTDAQTWVNKELVFTHGYGAVASPVNAVTSEGMPIFFVKDIPPSSSNDLKIDRPEIYFGEMTNIPIIVKGNIAEFDYPVGDSNKYTFYQGYAGVNIGSFFRRLIFAWNYSDVNYLVTNYIGPESKILYIRNISERVKKIAPFLHFDSDPYITIADGKLYWIFDAYTKTEFYPYSTPFERKYNYVRNSVKITVDAYNGEVNFYLFKPEADPIIRVYSKIFPDMFKDLDEMPQSVQVHLRYPQDLFDIQSKIYQQYHMTEPQIFYNKEDLWTIANEKFDSKVQLMESFYGIMRLPGQKKEEFLMLIPFTPNKRDNLIAWLCVRSDGEHYGKMLVYKFPKQELIFGPMQVSARIDQDPVISQEMTLWNQQGSRVSRGSLIVIPIEKSLLYVQPLYLQATEGQMPELKRVIVAYGNKIAMESSLDNALAKIFGGVVSTTENDNTRTGNLQNNQNIIVPGSDLSTLSKLALDRFLKAEEYMRAGNWAKYGEELELLKKDLINIVDQSKRK
jgi:uncharacterized membrane protein (UPF0182 family)